MDVNTDELVNNLYNALITRHETIGGNGNPLTREILHNSCIKCYYWWAHVSTVLNIIQPNAAVHEIIDQAWCKYEVYKLMET